MISIRRVTTKSISVTAGDGMLKSKERWGNRALGRARPVIKSLPKRRDILWRLVERSSSRSFWAQPG